MYPFFTIPFSSSSFLYPIVSSLTLLFYLISYAIYFPLKFRTSISYFHSSDLYFYCYFSFFLCSLLFFFIQHLFTSLLPLPHTLHPTLHTPQNFLIIPVSIHFAYLFAISHYDSLSFPITIITTYHLLPSIPPSIILHHFHYIEHNSLSSNTIHSHIYNPHFSFIFFIH